MVDSMIGYLAVCKTGWEYFRQDLQELIDSLDPFEKPAKIYHCLRNIGYKRGSIDFIMYTEKTFVMEVKPDGH